jgi:hypothetical protein
MDTWHYYDPIKKAAVGPLELPGLRALQKAGLIKEDTLVSCDAGENWLPFSDVDEIKQRPPLEEITPLPGTMDGALRPALLSRRGVIIAVTIAALFCGWLVVKAISSGGGRHSTVDPAASREIRVWTHEERQMNSLLGMLRPHYPSASREELLRIARAISGTDPVLHTDTAIFRITSILSTARASNWDEREVLDLAARATQSGVQKFDSEEASGAATPHIIREVALRRDRGSSTSFR